MRNRASKMTPRHLANLLQEHLPLKVADPSSFERWYEPFKWQVMSAAATVQEEVVEALHPEEEKLLESEGSVRRRAWRVTGSDGTSLLKTAGSIRTKVGRYFFSKAGDLPKGRFSLDQLEELIFGFEDLARFRVVAELPSDARCALNVLLPGRRKKMLLGRYPLASPLQDFVSDIDLRRAGSGHRARQFSVLVPGEHRRLRVETQIMTRFQDLWDRRNHPLYEWTRQGGHLPADLRVNDLALAEALHLMDEQAERNWKGFLRARRRQRR